MRTSRAANAVSRLNSRSEGCRYMMVLMGNGLLRLYERVEAGEKPLTAALALDDFVRVVDAMGPQKTPRITKSEAAFMQQLTKPPKA